MPDLITVVFILFVGAGWLLLATGWYGRAVDNHPHCRKCAFNLHTVWPGIAQCPECGTDLVAPGSVQVGVRRRRPVIMAAGLIILVLCSIWFSPWSRRSFRLTNWSQYTPDWYLVRQARSIDTDAAHAALKSIVARFGKKEFSEARLASLVPLALERQADPNATWSDHWGDVIEHAWAGNLLTTQQMHDYVTQACTFTIETNAQYTRQWEVVSVRSVTRVSRTGQAGLVVAMQPVRVVLGNRPISFMSDRAGRSRIVKDASRSLADIDFPVLPDPGEYELIVDWQITAAPGTVGTPAPSISLQAQHAAPISVLTPDPQSPELIVDPSIDARLREAISVRTVGLRVSPDSGPGEITRATVYVAVELVNAPVAANIHVQVQALGRSSPSRGSSLNVDIGQSETKYMQVPRVEVDASAVTITLTPRPQSRHMFGQNPDDVRDTPQRLWYGTPIIFSEVSIPWFDTADAPDFPENLRDVLFRL